MTIDAALNLSPSALVFAGTVVFIASFIRGYSGFGFSAILMAGLLPVIPASQLVPLSIALEILASTSQAPRIFRDINYRFLTVLIGAGLLGAPVGVYLLSYFSEQSLRYTVYGVIFFSTAAMLLLQSRRISITIPRLFVAGLFAGAANGATALSGLVLALFFTSSTISSRAMRATLIAYLYFTDLITGSLLLAADYYDMQTFWRGIAVLPVLLSGVWLGSRHFITTRQETFKTKVTWLILAFCAVGIIQMLLYP